jgi:hypothetical protein
MSHHLTEKQFAKCAAGLADRALSLHLEECAACRAELDRFSGAVSLFRDAVHRRVDSRPKPVISAQTPSRRVSTLRWAWVTAAAVAFVIPLLLSQRISQPVQPELSPDEVMSRMYLHLSRTVPEPMEPLMPLISSDEVMSPPGGIQ